MPLVSVFRKAAAGASLVASLLSTGNAQETPLTPTPQLASIPSSYSVPVSSAHRESEEKTVSTNVSSGLLSTFSFSPLLSRSYISEATQTYTNTVGKSQTYTLNNNAYELEVYSATDLRARKIGAAVQSPKNLQIIEGTDFIANAWNTFHCAKASFTADFLQRRADAAAGIPSDGMVSTRDPFDFDIGRDVQITATYLWPSKFGYQNKLTIGANIKSIEKSVTSKIPRGTFNISLDF